MDARARRVQAERNRRRLPQQRPAARWARRITGLVATAALLASGVAVATMVMPDNDEKSLAQAAPAATPVKEKPKKKKAVKKHKPKGPTKAQLAQRKAAVAIVREKGFTTLKQSDYDYKATLRVLIGRPVGDAAGGERAFFFNKETFLGNDAAGPSTKLSVYKQGKVTVFLSYGVYGPSDPPGDPSDRKRVRFRLKDGLLTTLDTVPLDSARFVPRSN